MRHDYNNPHLDAEICGDVGTGTRPYRDTCTDPEQIRAWQEEEAAERAKRGADDVDALNAARRLAAGPRNAPLDAAKALIPLCRSYRQSGHTAEADWLQAQINHFAEQGRLH